MAGKVMVVTARMGAGHDGAAAELCRRLEARGIRTQTVDFLDAAPWAGRLFQVVYELWLRWLPWAYEATYRIWFFVPLLCSPMVSLLSRIFGPRLRRWAADSGATVVVSTYPLASVVLGNMRRKRRRPFRLPVITFLTDFATHPLWAHRGVDLHLCVHRTTAEAVTESTGSPAIATGPLVSEAFRTSLPSKAEARRRLGIPLDARVVLVVAGSWGVGKLESTVRTLSGTGRYFTVAACGKNERLRQRLERSGSCMAMGWTHEMPALMAASDVLVQNAGGLTSMEAFAAGLPVVTFEPIPGHGRQNAVQMERAGVAPFVHTPSQLEAVLDQAMQTTELAAARGRSIFVGDAADNVEEVAAMGDPIQAPRRNGFTRRLVGAGAAATVVWVGLNVTAGAATAFGLGTAQPSGRPSAVYVGVRIGAASLGSAALAKFLARHQVAAVVEGHVAASDPSKVRHLSERGADVVNGGWGKAGRLHLLGQSSVAQSTVALQRALGRRVSLMAPDQSLSGVDLAIAGLEHVKVLDPVVELGASGTLPVVEPGSVYIVDAEGLGPSATQSRVRSVLGRIRSEGLRTGSMQSLA
ncbi:MAG: glycosyltransferase [Actinomycetota bacterium]|nr:glycosyltransferase [Actinomycetota bacterium]